jgi:hypothetical protein
MTLSEWVTIISVICAVVTSLIGGTWILRGALSKERDNTDAKIGRTYSRLDQYKDYIEVKIEKQGKDLKDDFVCKNVCKILHDQNDKNFERVEAKVDTLAVKFDEGMKEIVRLMQEKR